jgi:hypothetical protein
MLCHLGPYTNEEHRLVKKIIDAIIRGKPNTIGVWNPELKLWSLMPNGDWESDILDKLYTEYDPDKKLERLYIHRTYDYVCIVCGRKAHKETDHKPEYESRYTYLRKHGKLNIFEDHMRDCKLDGVKPLYYNRKGCTQMRNCNIICSDTGLQIVERTRDNASHAFINVDITQEDIDAYDKRPDAYLNEIFDSDNYNRFVSFLCTINNFSARSFMYIIRCSDKLRSQIISILKSLFGPFCFDNHRTVRTYYPRLAIHQTDLILPRHIRHRRPRYTFERWYVVALIGPLNMDPRRYKHHFCTKDIEMDPVPKSTIVKLALDIASHPPKKDSTIYVYEHYN